MKCLPLALRCFVPVSTCQTSWWTTKHHQTVKPFRCLWIDEWFCNGSFWKFQFEAARSVFFPLKLCLRQVQLCYYYYCDIINYDKLWLRLACYYYYHYYFCFYYYYSTTISMFVSFLVSLFHRSFLSLPAMDHLHFKVPPGYYTSRSLQDAIFQIS